MQLINAPAQGQFPAIEKALQPERIARYMPAANNDKGDAFKFYLWNCSLGEAFYVSLHFSEIVCRNAIHSALLNRCGDDWFRRDTLVNLLNRRFQSELDTVITEEGAKRQGNITANHVVSALTFGFWEHLTTKRFQRLLWPYGIRHNFPHAPQGKNREDLHDLIESVRRWRNRIAHHEPIFDKGPTRKHQDAMELIRWACRDTAAWVQSVSRVPSVVNLRPIAERGAG